MRNTFGFILLFFGIGSYAQNCVFIPEKDCINNLRIYIDREGNLYPPADLYQFDSDIFLNPSQNKKFNKQNTSKLDTYFEKDETALAAVCDKLGITKDFAELQDYLFQAYANKINQEAKKGNRIIFLIHGYNNFQEESLSSFYLLKHKLSKYSAISFVEVYWDGLANNTKSTKIWSSAQVNSSYVGLGVRKLLNKVNEDVEIVLLTHSLGASVATQALFNVDKWPKKYQKKLDTISNMIPTPPQKHITLCMIIPAIPGVNTFDDLNRTVENNTSQHIKKIIVGYNRKDKALIKKIGLSRYFGATSLGCDGRGEVLKTKTEISNFFPDILFKEINLGCKPMPKEHSIAEYMRATRFDEFLDMVFLQ